jgi:hypothetical protein
MPKYPFGATTEKELMRPYQVPMQKRILIERAKLGDLLAIECLKWLNKPLHVRIIQTVKYYFWKITKWQK